jgi:uncharacterized protein (DUF305 family)
MLLTRLPLAMICTATMLSGSSAGSDSPVDAALAETMATMHAAMHTVPMSGQADEDFARMMIPHHQGAIDMAKVELQFGSDPVLRRLAQEIIISQQSEIDVMKLALKKYPAPPAKE